MSVDGSTPKPDWLTDDYPSYGMIVDSWGFETVASQEFGSYQGDLAFILRGPTLGWGLIVIGYGSCSGCDELEATISSVGYHYDKDEPDTRDFGELVGLAKSLSDQVHWEATKDELAAWINATPERHWWSYEGDMAKWLNEQLGSHLPIKEEG